MIRKILVLLILTIAGISVNAQNYYTPGVPPSSVGFSPTFRYLTSTTDSLVNLYLANGNKYYRVFTAAQSRLLYAPSVAGGYVPTTRQILNGYAILGGTQLNNDITKSVDSTKVQTILNFFPKADTRYYTKTLSDARYAPIAGSGYKLNADSTASTGYLSRLTAQKYVTYDSPLKSLNMGSFNIMATNITGSILNSGGGYWNNSVLNLGSGGGAAVVVDYAGTTSSGIRFYDSASGQFGFTFNRTPGSPILSFGAFPSYGYASIGPSGVTSLGNPVEVTTNKVTTLDNSTTHYPSTSAITTALSGYAPITAGGYKQNSDSTAATGYQTVGNFFPKADTRYYTKTLSDSRYPITTLTGVATGDILIYDATSSTWKNNPLGSVAMTSNTTQTGLTGNKTSTGTYTFGGIVNNGTTQLVGNVGIGSAPNTAALFNISKISTGATVMIGNGISTTIQSDVTGSYVGYQSQLSTAAASFNLANMYDFSTVAGTIGAGSTIGNHVGFFAMPTLQGATNNYGFRGDIVAATGRWNFFAGGTAQNAFLGLTKFGATTVPIYNVDVAGTIGATGHVTFEGVTSTGATGTGNFVYSISPTFTGVPIVPTAAALTSTGQAASTAFVTTAISAIPARTPVSVTSSITMQLNFDYLNPSATQNTLTLPSCSVFNTDGSKIITVLATGTGGTKISVPSGYSLQSGSSFATTTGTGGVTLTQGQKVQLIPVNTNSYYLQPLNGTVTLY